LASLNNILKVRDDYEPIIFQPIEDRQYQIIKGGTNQIWFSGESFSVNELRGRIEPWLTSLFQSEHLSLLVGSGLFTAIQLISQKSTDAAKTIAVSSEYIETKEPSTKQDTPTSSNAPLNGMGAPELDNYPYSDKIQVAERAMQ
jgi:hypothetical protein